MKILFLDIDGVMNRQATWGKSYHHKAFDPLPAQLLESVLQATGAYIVISSTWRITETLDSLREVFNRHGISSNRLLDFTPRLGRNDPNGRGLEIGMWLEANGPNDFVYAIVDDDADMGVHLHRLVLTDYRVGLTQADADRLIALLNEQRHP